MCQQLSACCVKRRKPCHSNGEDTGNSTKMSRAAGWRILRPPSVANSSCSWRCRRNDDHNTTVRHRVVFTSTIVSDSYSGWKGCIGGRPWLFMLLLLLIFMDVGVNFGQCAFTPGRSTSVSERSSSTGHSSPISRSSAARSSHGSQSSSVARSSSVSGRSSTVPEHPSPGQRSFKMSDRSPVNGRPSAASEQSSVPRRSSSVSERSSVPVSSVPTRRSSSMTDRFSLAAKSSSSGPSPPVSGRSSLPARSAARGRSSPARFSSTSRRSSHGPRRSSPTVRSSSFRGRFSASRRPQAPKDRRQSEDPLARLSKVFGIKRIPANVMHRIPPQYMTDLYSQVADSAGLTRSSGPYNASTVRSLPDRDTVHQEHFFYNVSHLRDDEGEEGERMLEAEFHIFKMKPRPARSGETFPPHHLQLKVYQVLDMENMYSPDALRLLDARRISTHAHGWFTFKVTKAVEAWLLRADTNYGLLVTAQSHHGQLYNGSYIRFAQRHQHHDSKQPILVVFADDDNNRRPTYVSPDDQDYQQIRKEMNRRNQQRKADYRRERYQRKRVRASKQEGKDKVFSNGPAFNRNTKFLQDVLMLNERSRSAYNPHSGTSTSSPKQGKKRQKRATSAGSASGPGGGSGGGKKKKRQGRRKRTNDVGRYRFPRSCSRHKMYVDFDEIGWSGWIISPKGYDAYHCSGDCPFPLGQSQKPTNHATVQSIVHALRVGGKNLGTPCCVPNKLFSISLLYFDDDENVILKQYDDMVAASCGCH